MANPYDLFALTLLYKFSSDSEELQFGDFFKLVKYREDLLPFLPEDNILNKHLRLFPPDYLLWQSAPMESAGISEVLFRPEFSADEIVSKLGIACEVLFFSAVTNLFRLLRLFKPGRILAGDTFVVLSVPETPWRTTCSKRCSEVTIDYALLHAESGAYDFSSSDVPFFKVFNDSLLSRLEGLYDASYSGTPTPLDIALILYNQDAREPSVAIVNAFIALEALLTSESNAELSYRLSMRTANLLGFDDSSRQNYFKEMKEFYDLRSRIVHGNASKLNAKLQSRLQEIDALREVTRRVILSVMSLLWDDDALEIKLEELLDQISFDEAKRKEVQKRASKFLHVVGSPLYSVH